MTCVAYGGLGNQATSPFNVTVVDTKPPLAALDALPPYTAVSSVAISGAVSDSGSGVASVQAVVQNGAANLVFGPLAVDDQGRVAGVIGLTEGANQVVLDVTDVAGNETASAARTVVLDTVAPGVTILSPADGSSIGGTMVQIGFSVADSDGHGGDGGRPDAVPASGRGDQPVGDDSAGSRRAGTPSPSRPRTPPATPVGPSRTFSSHLSAPTLAIDITNGSAFGPRPGNSLAFALTVDDVGATTVMTSFGASFSLPRRGGVLHGAAPLTSGVNELVFTVTNEAGRTSALSRTVTYDVTPPVGSIVSPDAASFARGIASSRSSRPTI